MQHPDPNAVAKQLDQTFEKKIRKGKDQAKKSVESLTNQGQPISETFLDEAEGLDRQSIRDDFDRADLTSKYSEARTGTTNTAGTVADVFTIKAQHDFVATLERDVHARFRTRIRSVAYAASRRKGHASDKGPIERIRTAVKHYVSATPGSSARSAGGDG